MSVRILQGDCMTVLKGLPDESVHCIVSSPPYWRQRDYGMAGQLGLEPTPEEYIDKLVAIFAECRRILRTDGTAWVNLGDKWASGGNGGGGSFMVERSEAWAHVKKNKDWRSPPAGYKDKDLVGIPWAFAKACRDPHYVGRIKSELDRVWLAAMMDGEGTISGFYHDRADGTGVRTGVNVCLTNTCSLILDRAAKIWPASLHPHQQNNERLGTRDVFRWKPNGAENVGDFLAELYPYLMTKRRQAMLAWNLMQFSKNGQKWGRSDRADEVRQKRTILVRTISALNQGKQVEIPEWVMEPPSLYEQGWFLRQCNVWAKPNGMPESVRDRSTVSHEYVFHLTKNNDYWYDTDAARTPPAPATETRLAQNVEDQDGSTRANGGAKTNGPMKAVQRKNLPPTQANLGKLRDKQRGHSREHEGFNARWDAMERGEPMANGSNLRSVWWISPAQYREGHYAVMPDALAEICITAGCPRGGVVLDPFFGAGTTGLVADRLGRGCIGIELNPDYVEMAKRRITQDSPLFAEVA